MGDNDIFNCATDGTPQLCLIYSCSLRLGIWTLGDNSIVCIELYKPKITPFLFYAAELMFNGTFARLDKHQLVALVSCLVQVESSKEEPGLQKKLAEPLKIMQVRRGVGTPGGGGGRCCRKYWGNQYASCR